MRIGRTGVNAGPALQQTPFSEVACHFAVFIPGPAPTSWAVQRLSRVPWPQASELWWLVCPTWSPVPLFSLGQIQQGPPGRKKPEVLIYMGGGTGVGGVWGGLFQLWNFSSCSSSSPIFVNKEIVCVISIPAYSSLSRARGGLLQLVPAAQKCLWEDPGLSSSSCVWQHPGKPSEHGSLPVEQGVHDSINGRPPPSRYTVALGISKPACFHL